MTPKIHNQIVSFIWSVADDVLRDVFVRGKIPRHYSTFHRAKAFGCSISANKRKSVSHQLSHQQQGRNLTAFD